MFVLDRSFGDGVELMQVHAHPPTRGYLAAKVRDFMGLKSALKWA